MIPWAIPTLVSALMWKFIYNDQYGLFNDILYKLGVIDSYKAWLSTADGSFLALVITDVWTNGTIYGTFDFSWASDDFRRFVRSSQNRWGKVVFQRFCYVHSKCKRNILVALLFRTLDAFRVFDLVSVMTGGANQTVKCILICIQ